MRRIPVLVFLLSLLAGAGIYAFLNQPGMVTELAPGSTEEGQDLVYGSAHEHALFYLYVNGTEKDLTGDRFQLESRYVHLENNRSHIVHTHAEGVTWRYFLDTINVSIRRDESRLCVKVYSKNYCGNGTVMLSGQVKPDLSSRIEQGENFALVIGGNSTARARELMDRQLPRPYKPDETTGRRI